MPLKIAAKIVKNTIGSTNVSPRATRSRRRFSQPVPSMVPILVPVIRAAPVP
jgi:hypothetical protein